MRSIPLRWRVLTLLAVFALIVAACSSDDSDDTTTTEAAQEETTTTAAAEETTTTAGETTETTEAAQPAEGQLAGLSVVDENTFTVELASADPEFNLRLAYAAFFALPDVFFDDPAAFEESPIGNGPFMMDGVWEHDVRIPTVVNPDYAGPDPAQVDSWEFIIFADINTAYNEALAGNLDIMDGVPPDFVPTAPADFGDRYVESSDTSFNPYMGFPTYVPELTKEVRQALSMAVDRQLIIDKINLGGTAAYGVIPPPLGGTNDVCEAWSFNPEKAKEIWDASGGIEGITIWYNAGSGHEDWIEAVVNQWGENLDMDTSTVTFEPREWADYLPILNAGEATGPFRLGWGQDYPSPLNFLEPLFATSALPDTGGSNNTFYQNPEFDALLEEGKAAVAATGNLEDAMPFYQEAERLLCEDAQVIGIQFGLNQFVYNEGTSEVYMDSFGDVGYTVAQSEDGSVTQNLAEPQSLIPTNANESEGIAVLRALNTGLIQFEPIDNTQFNAHAESIATEDGGKTWTITLNPGWTFHDGTPVTAENYVKAWSYGADAANGQLNNSHYNNIVGYDELNPEEG